MWTRMASKSQRITSFCSQVLGLQRHVPPSPAVLVSYLPEKQGENDHQRVAGYSFFINGYLYSSVTHVDGVQL